MVITGVSVLTIFGKNYVFGKLTQMRSRIRSKAWYHRQRPEKSWWKTWFGGLIQWVVAEELDEGLGYEGDEPVPFATGELPLPGKGDWHGMVPGWSPTRDWNPVYMKEDAPWWWKLLPWWRVHQYFWRW